MWHVTKANQSSKLIHQYAKTNNIWIIRNFFWNGALVGVRSCGPFIGTTNMRKLIWQTKDITLNKCLVAKCPREMVKRPPSFVTDIIIFVCVHEAVTLCLRGGTFLKWRRSNLNYLFLFLGGIFINIMTDVLHNVQGNVLFLWVSCRSMQWWSSSKGIIAWIGWQQVSKLLNFFSKHPWIFIMIIIFQISVQNCERKISKKHHFKQFSSFFFILVKKKVQNEKIHH